VNRGADGNPFAPPDAEVHHDRPLDAELIFEGGSAIGTDPVEFPERCVRCGSDRPGGLHCRWRARRRRRWIAELFTWPTAPSCRLQCYLCPACTRRRRIWQGTAAGAALGLGAMLVYAVLVTPTPLWLFYACALIALLVTIRRAQAPLWIADHEERGFVIQGFSADFRLALMDDEDAAPSAAGFREVAD